VRHGENKTVFGSLLYLLTLNKHNVVKLKIEIEKVAVFHFQALTDVPLSGPYCRNMSLYFST
jgi:hypothetical protein